MPIDRERVLRFRMRFVWKSLIGVNPQIYAIWIALRFPMTAFGLTRQQTDLVLEGYPRSGNTFAWYAFMMSQTCPYSVAHHSHTPGRIIVACRHELPTLVLIRKPEDCVSSYCVYEPRLTPRLALRHWIRYYRTIRSYRNQYVLTAFDNVVSDFGAVIDHVNQTFNTKFDLFDHTDENVDRVFSKIDYRTNLIHERVAPISSLERQISRPSDVREDQKRRMKQKIKNDHRLLKLLKEATDLYMELIKGLEDFDGTK